MCTLRWGAEHSLRLGTAAAVLATLPLAGIPLRKAAADAPAFDYKGALQNCHVPVCVDGSSLQLELTSPHLTEPNITIVYPARATVVKGDLGEGTTTSKDSKNVDWEVTGHVQVFMPQGQLRADRASAQIVNDRVTLLTAKGSPAEFERSADGPAPPGLNGGTQAALEHAH